MADKDVVNEMADEMPEENIEKKPKKPSVLPIILKWVAVVLAVMIFVVAVTLVTVSIVGKKGKGFTEYPTSPEYRENTEILTYFTSLNAIKTNISGPPVGTIVVKINLGYSQEDKDTPGELSGRSIELQDFLRSYFRGKTYDELDSNEEAIKIELRNLINDNILTTGKIKRVMITQYDLVLQE